MSILKECHSPTSIGFPAEIDEILCAQAAVGWRLKQILQVRANYFLIVFEMESNG